MAWMNQDGEIVPRIPEEGRVTIGLAVAPVSTKLQVHCNECRLPIEEGAWSCAACGWQPAESDPVITSETDYDRDGRQLGKTRWFPHVPEVTE